MFFQILSSSFHSWITNQHWNKHHLPNPPRPSRGTEYLRLSGPGRDSPAAQRDAARFFYAVRKVRHVHYCSLSKLSTPGLRKPSAICSLQAFTPQICKVRSFIRGCDIYGIQASAWRTGCFPLREYGNLHLQFNISKTFNIFRKFQP